ncbi:MAG: hypothetical protein Cons2KO_01790 [Congregibacter sp.]
MLMETSRSKLETAALIAEILGGVAVVLSVVYLALQIADNNRLLRSQSHFNALEAAQRPFELQLTSDNLAGEMHQCAREPFEVADAVWERCSVYYFMQANGWEYTYLQHQDDAVPHSLWIGLDGYMEAQAITNPGWVRFWEDTALGFGEPFRSYIDERVRKNPAYRGD